MKHEFEEFTCFLLLTLFSKYFKPTLETICIHYCKFVNVM